MTANTFADTIPNSYFATDSIETPLSFATNPDGTNRFAGQSTEGVWNFQIQNQNANNVGSFTGVTINFQSTAVPEPGSVGLLAVGAVGGFFYLRRKKKNEEEAAEKAA